MLSPVKGRLPSTRIKPVGDADVTDLLVIYVLEGSRWSAKTIWIAWWNKGEELVRVLSG